MLIDLKKLTDEQIEAYKKAAREDDISVQNIIEGFAPLIEDYFITQIKVCKKSIHLTFPNGQKFIVYVKRA